MSDTATTFASVTVTGLWSPKEGAPRHLVASGMQGSLIFEIWENSEKSGNQPDYTLKLRRQTRSP